MLLNILLPVIFASTAFAVPIADDSHHHMQMSSTDNATQLVPVAHEMKHDHGMPILETKLTPAERLFWEQYNTTSFFTIDTANKGALWYHVISISACFLFLYPIAMMFNAVKSKWYFPSLTVYTVVLWSSLISLKVFGSSAPDLYPNNAYAKMSWILLFASLFQYIIAMFHCAARWASGEWVSVEEDDSSHHLIPMQDMDIENMRTGSPSTLIGDNRDSHEETEMHRERSPGTYQDSLDLENGEHNEYSSSFTKSYNKTTGFAARDNLLSRLFQNERIRPIAENFSSLISITFISMNIPMLLYLFVYIGTGIVTGTLMAQANHVFNILAHFIKGGVFVSLGILSLSRYCGCYKKSGLAWNKMVVFKNEVDTNSFWYRWVPPGMITMEGYESFLIFFYGTTNVFLEHLAAEPGVWAPKDLQHASIAFMYIGSGLCGLVTEKILSEWRFNQVLSNTKISPSAIYAGTPGYSPNPFPVFTIFWTGILMSQHEQASPTSTAIHMQWGYLLSYGSFFRLLTYVLLMLVPNKNLTPARPFTELITSFCLICGGFIFMQSNDQTVQALEYRGLTGMFTLNCNVGIVALIMGWQMVLLVWKSRLESTKQI